MLGAIIGDIAGSRFEFNNTDNYNFEIFSQESSFTDDTICTVAILDAILKAKKAGVKDPDFASSVIEFCNRFPHPMGGYGGRFAQWIRSEDHKPYGSYGNGSAMRVSPIAWVYNDIQTVTRQAERSAAISHNHPEGIKGAVAVAHAIFWLRHTKRVENLETIGNQYYPGFMLKDYFPGVFDETCQGTVPLCFKIVRYSSSFEDAIRKAVSFGGDSDTIGAIVGSLAEAAFQIPLKMQVKAYKSLPTDFRQLISAGYAVSKWNYDMLDDTINKCQTALAIAGVESPYSYVRHLFHSDPVSFHSQIIRIDGELYRSIPEEYIRRSYNPNGILTIEHSHTPFNEKPSITDEFFNSKKRTLKF